MRTMNRITRQEQRQLEDIVQQHEAEITAGRWTMDSLAQVASRQMGRNVTAGNIKGAAKTMSIVFRDGCAKAGRSMKELRACVKLLARELVGMKKALGVVACPELEALAQCVPDDGFDHT